MNIPVLETSFNGLNNLLYKSYLPKIINTAVDAGIFEELSNTPMNFSILSGKTGTDERITEALLDVMTAINLLEKTDGKYRLSFLAKDFLLKDSAVNQAAAFKMFSGSAGPFDNLGEVLKNGPSEFNQKMWSSREAAAGMEEGAKGGLWQSVVSFIKDIPEFKLCTRMCDFAGSTGYYSLALMDENSKLKSCVYDLPEVCKIAEELREKEINRGRITFHRGNLIKKSSFGSDYDLFFCSHFLYEFAAKNNLSVFLKKVNRSMKHGGLFVSSHISPASAGENYLTLTIVELITRCMGYPTHQISEMTMKKSLNEAGFGKFRIKQLDKEASIPTLLLSAVKINEK